MTRKLHHLFAIGLIGSLGLSLIALDAKADPLVIPGIGPGDVISLPQGLRRAPATVPATRGGGYGGGFIELLVTGRTPGRPTAMTAASGIDAGQMRPDRLYMPARQAAPPAPAASSLMAYAPMEAAPRRLIDPKFERQEVDYTGGQAAGTLVIDTPNKFLYLVAGNGRALRYGIGVGRPGFEWSGVKTISRKAEWPAWTPPAEMLLRRPDLPRHMDGGPQNPLGARAMYLGSSLYRIHGTNEPQTIGTNVSSGCIRLTNDDVTDLYARVRVGAKVVVM